jgi:predicted  nucleic acid-binding Zn-ribbon protein
MKSTTSKEQSKALNEYHDLNNEIQETEEKIDDLKDSLKDLKFEKFEYKIEFEAELDEDSLKYIEHKIEKLENNPAKAGEILALSLNKENSIAGILLDAGERLQ